MSKSDASSIRGKQKSAPRGATNRPRSVAKVQGLATVDNLLERAGASAKKDSRSTALRSEKPKVAPQGPQSDSSAAALDAGDLGRDGNQSRLERCLERVRRGEPGPIKISDLTIEDSAVIGATNSGGVEFFKKILASNPGAQPGRPIVNVEGDADSNLKFRVLTQLDLVLAAKDVGVQALQVSLVRLPVGEATELLTRDKSNIPAQARSLSPREIANLNGFLELSIADIQRHENLRQEIRLDSPDFQNLVESIRVIGLQNPPVVEVREHPENPSESVYVCVSGHRRLLAMEFLGITSVTCALKTFANSRHRALAGLAENINREDLHFLDKADGYGLLVNQGMAAHEISALLDTDVRTINKYIRASTWDPEIKRRVRELGSKLTIRFLLNTLAAAERSTSDAHTMIDKFIASLDKSRDGSHTASENIRRRLDDFCSLSRLNIEQRSLIEKALKYLGVLR